MERLLLWTLKNTIYAQFCGGETIQDVKRIIEELQKDKIGVILDYAAEPDLSPSNTNFPVPEHMLQDQVSSNVLEAIDAASQATNAMVTVKLSGLFDSSFLRLLNGSSRYSDDIAASRIEQTTGWKHLNQICLAAKKKSIQIAVDAEQSFIQNAIDLITRHLMRKYNSVGCSPRPLVLNTYQMYRKDALERLQADILEAKETHRHFGAKIVRGAYVVGEMMWAAQEQRKSPVFGSIEETHRSYNDAIRLVFELAESLKGAPEDSRKFFFVFATHNIESLKMAAEKCVKDGLPTDTVGVAFAQLFGMSDAISLSMAKAGYRVYKYLPFGPVHAVLPYLIRRSEENSSVFKMAGSDAQMIWEELKSRIRPQSAK